ncbi:ABC transporter ATP-binding protein [Desnuesiella massiliensis]|uniref:ABC transporter ATP-binding protein n=1 Tax=Desnuesiella massiliensis TaxID=1650662 RepID=UPI0006E154A8|nr:ABC transporter ATP-binding protein [Desnuesiella massiliensis]
MNTIQISNVTKEYKNNVKGLENVSFSIGSGVFGLLGHNGAGKTTLMKAMATIIKPTRGNIVINGMDSIKDGDGVRKIIGYLPQELTMYPNLTAFDFVSYMAELKGISNKAEVLNALEQVDMQEFKKRKISQLSGGMKRRIGIAQAIVGSPRILIVDEPTAGLDPTERVRFRGVISRYAKDGNTVILSTHIVEDVYQLCENLAILRKGKLFFAGASRELTSQVRNRVKVLEITDESELIDIQKKAVVISTTYEKKHINVRLLDEQGIFTAKPVSETLEDAYIYCMGGS